MNQAYQLISLLVVLAGMACGSGGTSITASGGPELPGDSTPQPPPDSVPAPIDTVPVDTVTPPAVDTTSPPDSLSPSDPPHIPTHAGILFGPAHLPSTRYGKDYSGSFYHANPGELMATLEAARRADLRLILGLTGNERRMRDANGFSFPMWQALVDRFRDLDFSSYIEDGTIVGHFIMDEPTDRNNWNGHQVTPAQINEMARYSKELWPTMPVIIRAWPDYLLGHSYPQLDAVWVQYSGTNARSRGPIEDFIGRNVRDAKALDLELILGLNILNGGKRDSGIPGLTPGKYGMSASEIKTWGSALMAEPHLCAFVMWKYDAAYLERPDVKEALAGLNQKSQQLPKRGCARR